MGGQSNRSSFTAAGFRVYVNILPRRNRMDLSKRDTHSSFERYVFGVSECLALRICWNGCTALGIEGVYSH